MIHPDIIYDFTRWTRFGRQLAIENINRRKPIGRTACELSAVYEKLPDASLCFDVGRARQCDPSMTEAFLILSRFRDKFVEIHISEVNSASQHDPISHGAKIAFPQIARMISEWIPVIIESRVTPAQIVTEASRAVEALAPARLSPETLSCPMSARPRADATGIRRGAHKALYVGSTARGAERPSHAERSASPL